jgi:hypothetical protein
MSSATSVATVAEAAADAVAQAEERTVVVEE